MTLSVFFFSCRRLGNERGKKIRVDGIDRECFITVGNLLVSSSFLYRRYNKDVEVVSFSIYIFFCFYSTWMQLAQIICLCLLSSSSLDDESSVLIGSLIWRSHCNTIGSDKKTRRRKKNFRGKWWTIERVVSEEGNQPNATILRSVVGEKK